MKLSIITINKNDAIGLEKTIQSIVNQVFYDFEYIVVDGNSNDTSVEVIKKYTDKITWWISEPDSGIYNAMNKGIRQARGDYCLFLNGGDCLISSETLYNVFDEINTIKEADIYYSNTLNTNNKYIRHPEDIDISYLIKTRINHQNSLIKRFLFEKHNYYNESLKIASDWEFFLKELWLYKSKFLHLNTGISIFDINGISSKKADILHQENSEVIKNVFGELSETITAFRYYHQSVYGDIIDRWGNTSLLDFILRVYKLPFKIRDFFHEKLNKKTENR
jgi:glycosyltransferase involved in cell wall biosynthesis